MAEYKGAKVTVIVDATFGHRIAKKERAEFEKALANNELVTPPAGAVGRGDAFILAIADKVNAAIFSNDSFQEFHGKFKWLFDEGRLIGGKPVPLVGWVLVERLPVRGPTSRRSVKNGGVVAKALPAASPEASKPMPVPKTPPPNVRLAKSAAVAAKQNTATSTKSSASTTKPTATMVNDLVSFLEFVEKHPVGAKVKAVVETYAANGVSVRMGSIAGYVPLKNMATPIPRSARDVFKLGDQVSLMVVGYSPSRRSVDLGVPDVVSAKVAESLEQDTKKKSKKTATAKSGVVKKSPAKKTSASGRKSTVAEKTPAKKIAVKKAVTKKVVAKKTVVKKAVAKKDEATPVKKAVRPSVKKAASAKKSAPKKK